MSNWQPIPIIIDEMTHLSKKDRFELKRRLLAEEVKPILCQWCLKAFLIAQESDSVGPPHHLHKDRLCIGSHMHYLDGNDVREARKFVHAFDLLLARFSLTQYEPSLIYYPTGTDEEPTEGQPTEEAIR